MTQSAAKTSVGISVRPANSKRLLIIGLVAVATILGTLSIKSLDVEARGGRIFGGALLGAGVGAIFGGRRGVVAGAITGGLLGALSKRKKKWKKRRW